MKYVRLYIAASASITIIGFFIFISSRPYGAVRDLFYQEDSLIENLTACLFMLTFLFALAVLLTKDINQDFNRKWLVILLVLGLCGFLDEISYGERLLDLDMPEWGGIKIDAVHDIFELIVINMTDKLMTRDELLMLILLSGVFLISLSAHPRIRIMLKNAVVSDRRFPLLLLMFFFVALILSALILDADLLPFKGSPVVEELFELYAAMALLVSCIFIYQSDVKHSSGSY